MKKNNLLILILLLILASFLSACSGGTGAAASWPGLSVDQDRAYLAYNQFVYAIDLKTGTQIWRFPDEKAESNVTFFAPPVVYDGTIFVGSYTQSGSASNLYSLDAETGQVKAVFSESKNNYVAAVLVTENGIYAPNADGNLYALDFDLNLRWKYPTERAIWASPSTNEACDCIFVASMDHRLYAINALSGTLDWKTDDLGGALAAPPTFGSNNTLYLGTSDKQMLALNAQDGTTKWVYNTSGWIWSGVSLQDGSLYFGDLEGYLYALDSETGSEKWSVQADGAILTKPLVYNNQIYYTTENTNVYAVDLDGKPAWRQETNAKVYSPVISSGDLILVALTDNEAPLIAYDQDGQLRWTFSLATE